VRVVAVLWLQQLMLMLLKHLDRVVRHDDDDHCPVSSDVR
jgi:hypothetical protein